MSTDFKCPKCGKRALTMPNFRKEREHGRVTVKCTACGLSVVVPAIEDAEKIDVFGDLLDVYQEMKKAAKPIAPAPDSNYEYNAWEPPASTTLFCKMAGVPYQYLRSHMASGNEPEEMASIKERLETHKYKCRICVHYEKPACNLKNKTANPDAICKGFEPDLQVPE